MTLTRDFNEPVWERIASDPAFAGALRSRDGCGLTRARRECFTMLSLRQTAGAENLVLGPVKAPYPGLIGPGGVRMAAQH